MRSMRADPDPGRRERRGSAAGRVAVALVALAAAACAPPSPDGSDPARDTVQRRDTMARDAGDRRSIHDVLADRREAWMARPEVTGLGVGRCGEEPCIVVYLLRSTPEAEEAFPDTVEGHPVRLEVTGRFEAGGGAAEAPDRP